MHALEHSSIHVRATKFEDAARRHNACGSACMKPPCWHARGAALKPREVAGLRGTTMQLVSSHMCARFLVDVEIITGDLLQTAQGLRSTGLQSSSAYQGHKLRSTRRPLARLSTAARPAPT
jgi:hypothetical protein